MASAAPRALDDLDAFLGDAGTRGIYATALDDDLLHSPVRLRSADQPENAEMIALLNRYEAYGVAVFELAGTAPDEADVAALAAGLGLGPAFVPPTYRVASTRGLYRRDGLNVLSATHGDGFSHPAFTTTTGQQLHSDGTVQPIGVVRTSILLCLSQAADGGDSVLFNSVAAFCRLAQEDLAAARALTTDCLRRTATVGTIDESLLGPAFALQHGRLVSRYSVTHTESWEFPVGTDVPALRRALARMDELSAPGSDLRAELRLAPGQGLIMANDQIAHGRTAYRDAPGHVRTMVRGLFLGRLQAAS